MTDQDLETHSTTDVSPTVRRPPWLRPLLSRVHFYAGVFIGPFLLVAALTGLVYALTPTVEKLVYADELTAPVASTQLSLAEQVAAAQTYAGADLPVYAVRPAPEPGDTTRIMYVDDSLADSEHRAVFVDPGTGEIRGDLTVYGTSGSLPLRNWLAQVHKTLGLGEVGRFYSELAASWLAVIAVVGLVLWVSRVRKVRRKREMVLPTLHAKGFRRSRSWHTSLGIWVLLGALFLAATGITWSRFAGANVSELRSTLNSATPAISSTLPDAPTGSDHSGGHGDHGPSVEGDLVDVEHIDHVVAAARAANIHADEIEIRPPADVSRAWVVREIKMDLPTSLNSVAIDGRDLSVVDTVNFADYPLLAKLSSWGVYLHMGTLFGLANELLLAAVALGLITLIVLGYRMWWQRGKGSRFGRPPGRGALRAAPWWGVALVVLVAAAVGWALPVLGVSLLVFIALDLVIGRVRRRPPADPRT